MASAVHVRCPAKVNLHLEVLGRRPDGYHELRTLFCAVGVWDELTLVAEREGAFNLVVEPAGAVTAGDDNLVLRAARAAAASWGVARGVRASLHKRIPIAGGMAGGSANAAATLVGVARLWGVAVDALELHRLAAQLGSDVPFFLVGGAALGVGRGGELRPLPDPPPWWILLLPGEEPVPTSEIYANLVLPEAPASLGSTVYDWLEDGGEPPLSAFHNDLEATVVARFPWVGRRLGALRATRPLLAMVSGSGGTVFALYADEARAREEGRRLGGRRLVAPVLRRADSLLRPTVVEAE